MADKKLYANKPGGVLLHQQDGTSRNYAYGEVVDPSDLADYQRENLSDFTTSNSPKPEADVRADLIRRAQDSAAMADSGQPNSSSSPIPANYDELDEDAAVRFLSALRAYPQQQGEVVAHEKLHQNRRKVIDAATEEAQDHAKLRIEDLKDSNLVPPQKQKGGEKEPDEPQTAHDADEPTPAGAEG